MSGLNGSHFRSMLTGTMELGENYLLGGDCRRKHGVNGKTLRTKSGKCVFCQQDAGRKAILKAEQGIAGVNKKVAIDHLREEMEIKKISEESFLD